MEHLDLKDSKGEDDTLNTQDSCHDTHMTREWCVAWRVACQSHVRDDMPAWAGVVVDGKVGGGGGLGVQ